MFGGIPRGQGLAQGLQIRLKRGFHRGVKRVLRKAGLRDIRFHDIRHTYASLLLTAGVSPVYVKEQLGHASIQMTVDIYGHLIPGSNRDRDQVNLLDAPPAATYPQPAKNQEAQPRGISNASWEAA